MATPQEYTIGANAALAIINADIAQDVPSFFQGEISEDERTQIANTVATAVIDALDAYRAQEQTPVPGAA